MGSENKRDIRIEKIVAAGNDFLFALIGRDTPADWSATSGFAKEICDRHFGIGADGLVLMQRTDSRNYEWTFFNSDGSYAAMCGNAARAAARFVSESAQWPISLKTGFGNVVLESESEDLYRVTIDYSDKKLNPRSIGSAVLLDTGVPHVVIESAGDVLTLRDRSLAAPYRWAKEAGEGGANVTFFRRISGEAIEAITFERGVEDYTLSCGTGVLAAATVASGALSDGKWPNEMSVKNPGGNLRVAAINFPNKLTLTGPAKTVFQTKIQV